MPLARDVSFSSTSFELVQSAQAQKGPDELEEKSPRVELEDYQLESLE